MNQSEGHGNMDPLPMHYKRNVSWSVPSNLSRPDWTGLSTRQRVGGERGENPVESLVQSVVGSAPHAHARTSSN